MFELGATQPSHWSWGIGTLPLGKSARSWGRVSRLRVELGIGINLIQFILWHFGRRISQIKDRLKKSFKCLPAKDNKCSIPQIWNCFLCSFWALQPCSPVWLNTQAAGVHQSEPTPIHVWLVVFGLSAFLPLCCSVPGWETSRRCRTCSALCCCSLQVNGASSRP